MGFFSVITIVITWTINNQESESQQGAGFAVLQVIGQCGPLVGTRLYPEEEAPFYVRGMGVCAGAMVAVAVLAVGLRIYLGKKEWEGCVWEDWGGEAGVYVYALKAYRA